MKSTLQQILTLVSKSGFKTSEGQITGVVVSLAVGTILAAIDKWFENRTSDAPAFLIVIALLVMLFAVKWYSEHRTSIKGELGRLLNNPLIVEIIQGLEGPLAEETQKRLQVQGALPPEQVAAVRLKLADIRSEVMVMETGGRGKSSEAPPPPPPAEPELPGKLEILRDGQTEIQTFATRQLACDEADRLRKETPGIKVYVL